MPINYESVYNTLRQKRYKIFEKDRVDYNLNIIGIRNLPYTDNAFDDTLILMWKFLGEWKFRQYNITTDPGKRYLNSPMNNHGTAILMEGQYSRSHMLGTHKGYKALQQCGPLVVWRDRNKDDIMDFANPEEGNGFGLNIHRASARRKSIRVDSWSAGCQVFADPEQFKEFMGLVHHASENFGKYFTYTLINSTDLD